VRRHQEGVTRSFIFCWHYWTCRCFNFHGEYSGRECHGGWGLMHSNGRQSLWGLSFIST
jgi:hypothetical protein